MKKITKTQLNQSLQQHQLWLNSDGVRGERANLRGADLRHTQLCYANLSDTDLRGANLQSANLRHTNLRRANLIGADINRADISHADLRGAQFNTNIRDCFIFRGTQFTPEALPWLILHPRWAEWKDTVWIDTE
jgi:uncharacterized protein YjbI with pentapeptide repeats